MSDEKVLSSAFSSIGDGQVGITRPFHYLLLPLHFITLFYEME
jgi:hypothetical protein